MDLSARIEHDLKSALSRIEAADCPPRLAEAMKYAVFPGGARIRPRLTLAVTAACGDGNMLAGLTAATAIELLHCASLVHDDLPCFDGADVRRGKPSVHKAFGEPLALLVGDALIVHAFETVALRLALLPGRLISLTRIIAASVGAPSGIIAGQAWECEPAMEIVKYQRLKTGSLFAACTMAGAAASGEDPTAWRPMGLAIGEAFQVADDILDVASEAADIGKPTGQDEAHGRPNAVVAMGPDGAKRHFDSLLEAAIAAVPECPGAEQLRMQIVAVSQTLVKNIGARRAA
jgi:geranylgeranyl diphosphate synthase type II